MNDSDNNRPLSTGEWFITILVLALPLIGLIMQFVWAFSDGNIGRRNFCRAALIWAAIFLGLGLLALLGMVLMGGLLAGAASSY